MSALRILLLIPVALLCSARLSKMRFQTQAR